MPAGRPTNYSPEKARLICRRVATSTLSTGKLCALHDDMPCETTLYEWRLDHKEFAECYAQAKAQQAELLAEKISEMAAEKEHYFDSEGNKRVDSGFIQSQRLQVDTTKWIASKLLPKVYGDHKQIENLTNTNNDLQKELAELREQLADKNKRDY